jgi:hypothetical protein
MYARRICLSLALCAPASAQADPASSFAEAPSFLRTVPACRFKARWTAPDRLTFDQGGGVRQLEIATGGEEPGSFPPSVAPRLFRREWYLTGPYDAPWVPSADGRLHAFV